MEGWIKIHRKLLESNVFDNEKVLKIWIWCLLKATHTEQKPIIGMQIVKLKPGQFIFGRDKAAAELKMKPSTVYKYLRVLKNNGNINIKCNNKFSVVTIEKWDLYQTDFEKSSSKGTTKEQQRNTYKNDKNVKNVYKRNQRKYDDSFYNNLYNFEDYGG